MDKKATATKEKLDEVTRLAAPTLKKAKDLQAEIAKLVQQLRPVLDKLNTSLKQVTDAKEKLTALEVGLRNLTQARNKSAAAVDQAKADEAAAIQALADARSKYHFRLAPVVGFSADWAGTEAVESLEKATYVRWIPNMIGVPRRMIDWSLFNREVQREFKGRFDEWIFWENPDLDDSPQSIPPEKYAEMLKIFSRWVKLYNPNARVDRRRV